MPLEEAARIMREATRDKSYLKMGLGPEIAGYLRANHMRLAPSSYRTYEVVLDKLARHFADVRIAELEPPVGTERVEEFLDSQWGEMNARTYRKALSVLSEFFEFCVVRQKLHGDPTTPIKPPKAPGVHRTTFSNDERRGIIAIANRRDAIALRLLFDYGLRRSSLLAVQFRHFDHQRKRLVIYAKGGKVREMPVPDPHFWMDLERHILDVSAEPQHFLLTGRKRVSRDIPGAERPEQPMSEHAAYKWWYRCLADAGIVAQGTTSGQKMHKARHTAGQRVLDASGNLKAVQKLLGHSSIQTTGDVYADWDIDQLAGTMAQVLSDD